MDISYCRQRFCTYDPECIFNVEEISLFLNFLLRRSQIITSEDKSTVRGTKAMLVKNYITAYVCTNAFRKMLPMAVIGNFKGLRCFQIFPRKVPYSSRRNAWLGGARFRRWFDSVFVPFLWKLMSNQVVFLMGNCGPHGGDLTDLQQEISIATFSLKCTSIHQPMDMRFSCLLVWKFGKLFTICYEK